MAETASTAPTRVPQRSDGFWIQERDGLRLITPTDRKYLWKPEHLFFRSAIVDDSGRIVSSGFPKFFNAGEAQAAAVQRQLVNELQSGAEVWAEEKLDGALIIRSVIEGEVVFRTRKTFDGGERGEEVRRLAAERYPALLDPALHGDQSLLFEHLSSDPRFRVVLGYEQDDLVFLDAVDHQALELSTRETKEAIAEALALRLVASHPLPHSLKELEREVAAWDNREGVVIRFSAGQGLMKVKSRQYLKLHRLKHRLSASGIREFCEQNKVRTPEAFERQMKRAGGDWEILEAARAPVEAYCAALERSETRISELEVEVEMLFVANPGRPDAVKAAINELPESEREVALLLFDGREGPAEERLRTMMVEKALQPFDT